MGGPRDFHVVRAIVTSLRAVWLGRGRGWRGSDGTPLRRFVANAGWVAAGGSAASLLALVESVAAARLLGAEEYGKFAVIVASAGLVLQFADFRTWEATIALLPARILSGGRRQAGALVGCLLAVDIASGILATGTVWVCGPILSGLVANDPSVNGLLRIFGVSLPMTLVGAGTCTGLLRVYDRFDLLAAKSVGIGVVHLALTLVALLLDWGLPGLIWVSLICEGLSAATAVAMGINVAKVRARDLWPPRHMELGAAVTEVRRLLPQLWISGTIKGVQTRIDILLLGALTSPAAVAQYRLAMDMAGVLSKVGNPIQASIMPLVSELGALGRVGDIRRLALVTTVLLSCIVVPILLTVAAVGPALVTAAGGRSYAGAGSLLVLISTGVGVNVVLGSWARPLVVVRSVVGVANLAMGVLGIGGAVGMLVLVPALGATGAALVTGAVYAGSGASMAAIALFGCRHGTQRRLDCGEGSAAKQSERGGHLVAAGGKSDAGPKGDEHGGGRAIVWS